MYCVLMTIPAAQSKQDVWDNLDAAFGVGEDEQRPYTMPDSTFATGTEKGGGKQVIMFLSPIPQNELEAALQDAGLNQYNVIAFQTFHNEYQGDDQDGNPIYAPTVTTQLENGNLVYLRKRYTDETGTVEIPKAANWFPQYQGQVPWL